MSSIAQRIKEIRKYYGKTQQSFADAIGLKRNTIATYEIGNAFPSDRTISDICQKFNVSEVWLRTGEGQMLMDIGKDQELLQIFTEIQMSDDEAIKKFLIAYWKLGENEKAGFQKLIASLSEK